MANRGYKRNSMKIRRANSEQRKIEGETATMHNCILLMCYSGCLLNASHWKLHRDFSTFSCAFANQTFATVMCVHIQLPVFYKTKINVAWERRLNVWFPNKWADEVDFMHSNIIVSCQMPRIKHSCYVNVPLEYDVMPTIWYFGRFNTSKI